MRYPPAGSACRGVCLPRRRYVISGLPGAADQDVSAAGGRRGGECGRHRGHREAGFDVGSERLAAGQDRLQTGQQSFRAGVSGQAPGRFVRQVRMGQRRGSGWAGEAQRQRVAVEAGEVDESPVEGIAPGPGGTRFLPPLQLF